MVDLQGRNTIKSCEPHVKVNPRHFDGTVDGRNPANQLIGSSSLCLQAFIHPRLLYIQIYVGNMRNIASRHLSQE